MRPRLLPVLMFALVATATVKLGAVWNAVEVSIGSESLAQTQPAAETPLPVNPETAAPESGAAATEATAPQSPAPGTAPQPPAPGSGTAESATGESPTPESTTADSAAPAQAPAQAAIGEPAPETDAAALAPDAAVPDPFDYTDEEIDVLQQLSKRREALDLRARQLDEREALIQAAEQRMDQKMAELKALQAMVENLLKQRSDEQEAELKSVVKMYENMKPKDAAQVFEEMDMDVLLDVVERMNERKAAPILALVTPTRAKEITFELAQRKVLPLPE